MNPWSSASLKSLNGCMPVERGMMPTIAMEIMNACLDSTVCIRETVTEEPINQERNGPTHGGFMTCMETCGNGAMIGMMISPTG